MSIALTRDMGDLRARVEKLEQEVAQLREALRAEEPTKGLRRWLTLKDVKDAKADG